MVFFSPRKSLFISSRLRAFTLVELLVVIAIMAVLMALLVPSFTSLKGAGDATKAAYDVSGVLENARAYATANNTYVWVGFFEEDVTKLLQATPVVSGTGRIVISTVASKDGTTIYNSLPTTSGTMTPGLLQVNKLTKIDNMHLKTAGDASFPLGNPSSASTSAFDTRPAPSPLPATVWQIGSTSLTNGSSQVPFQYPVGNPVPPTQYTFKTGIQFSPRGEARVLDNSGMPLQTIVEIGLQPARGNVVDVNNKNVAAVQVTGITGNVKIYRR